MYIKKKKIIAVTGSRSEYDLLVSVYNKLAKNELFDFSIIITGPHLSQTFGNTHLLVKEDGFNIAAELNTFEEGNEKIYRIKSIGNQIIALSKILAHEKPDFVLVAGDREEAISVTMTCAFLDVCCCHFFGGDIAKDGNIDNSVRYASSKFAHYHFVTLMQHKENLLRLGEDDSRIFVVGNPALDRIVNEEYLSRLQLSEIIQFDLTSEPYLLLIQHPIITEYDKERENILETLNAINEIGMKCFINYPNSDAGNIPIIESINRFAENNKNIKLFKNLDRITYVNLMRNASCLVGNSSSGILEAPSLHLPVVNIGPRQVGRIHANNVIFVGYDKIEIKNAINYVLYDETFRKNLRTCKNPYGDGTSSEKIVNILSELNIDDAILHKNITY